MTFDQVIDDMRADEISRLADLLSQGNRCNSCGTCERCYAIWAPRPISIEDHARWLFARLKVPAEATGAEHETDHAD